MAPHLSAAELDHVQKLLQKGKSTVEIHHSLRASFGRIGRMLDFRFLTGGSGMLLS